MKQISGRTDFVAVTGGASGEKGGKSEKGEKSFGFGVWDLGWMLMGFMRYGVFSRLKLFVVRFRCLFMGLKSGGHLWDSYRSIHLRGVHLWDSISMKLIP